LQAVRDLPAHLYNAGLEAAQSGDSFGAILKVAAASQLGERPEPWVVLGKLFTNDGAEEYGQVCFLKAQSLGITIPETWLGSNGADKSEAAMAAEPPTSSQAEFPVNGSRERAVGVPLAVRLGVPQSVAGWAMIAILLGTGIGIGWRARDYREMVAAVQPREEYVMPQQVASAEKLPSHTSPTVAAPESPVQPDQGETQAVSRVEPPQPSQPEVKRQIFGTESHQETQELKSPVQPASVLTSPDPEAGRSSATARYVVEPGDSLWQIAKSHLGAGWRWRSLYEANRKSLTSPDHLVVGQALVIPNAPE
jgi:LysM repeat protein